MALELTVLFRPKKGANKDFECANTWSFGACSGLLFESAEVKAIHGRGPEQGSGRRLEGEVGEKRIYSVFLSVPWHAAFVARLSVLKLILKND
jgi:hypothetical protein